MIEALLYAFSPDEARLREEVTLAEAAMKTSARAVIATASSADRLPFTAAPAGRHESAILLTAGLLGIRSSLSQNLDCKWRDADHFWPAVQSTTNKSAAFCP